MQQSLATCAVECAQAFEKLSTLPQPQFEQHTHLRQDDIEDQDGRFRIWAGNLGAFQKLPSKSSLDYRLRESPKVAIQVQELLQDLHRALDDSKRGLE